MEICKELKILSKEFEKNKFSLYIVGGFVRDSLLSRTPKDIDLTSNMPYENVIELCKKLNFKATTINKSLGTIKIIANNEQFEYTQFRKESYITGKHSPDKVEFIDDIEKDAYRRDISINSLYYKISEERIIDLIHGQKDLQNKIIRTVNEPETTLKDDGLRILRIIRFASLLNFRIEKNTFKALKTYRYNLKNISKERILKELQLITQSDLIYQNENHIFLNSFNKLNLYELIFNHSFARIKKPNKKDIINFYNLKQNSRLIGFYFLILKNFVFGYQSSNHLEFTCNLLLGLDGINESKNNIQTLEKLFLIYQNIRYNKDILNASINYLILSDAEKDILNNFLDSKTKIRLNDNIKYVKDKNLPLSIHELDISPQDLINNKIKNIYINKIMTTLFNQVIEMKVNNTKEELIKLAIDINNTFESITKQQGENNENNLLSSRRKISKSKNKKNSK